MIKRTHIACCWLTVALAGDMDSMTGFGAGRGVADGRAYRVEIKTVNHKNLSVRMHLPSELQSVEGTAKRLVSKRLGRGHIDVSVRLESSGNDRVRLTSQAIDLAEDAMIRLPSWSAPAAWLTQLQIEEGNLNDAREAALRLARVLL